MGVKSMDLKLDVSFTQVHKVDPRVAKIKKMSPYIESISNFFDLGPLGSV